MVESVLSVAAKSQDVAAFLALSAKIGRDPGLIQVSGGNTSIKQGETLWVKASGTCLRDAADEDIMVPVDLDAVRRDIEKGETDPVSAHVIGGGLLRPSIETTLHALLPHPVVMHVHSVNALAWTTLADGRDRVAEPMNGLNWAWVPYTRPGLPLTQATASAMSAKPDILVLQNHGLVAGGAAADEVEAILDDVESRLRAGGRVLPEPDLDALKQCAPDGFAPARDHATHGLATDADCLEHVRRGPLYPDHVVFLGPEAPIVAVDGCCATVLADYEARYGDRPRYLIVAGLGVLVAQKPAFGVEEMLLCQAEVLARIKAGDELRHLDQTEIAELMNWDAEKYRRTLNP